MNLTSPTEVRRLLEQLGASPSKALGQNFLIDGNILKKIVEAADLQPTDRVLEIGPGLGVLTLAMLERVDKVVAVEKDRLMVSHLRDRLADSDRFYLMESDALDLDLPGLVSAGLNKCVSNLPYSVGNRILMEFFKSRVHLDRIVVTVQDEVAGRIAASPGTKAYGMLSIWAQLDYEMISYKKISPTCFYPPPTVDSAVIALARRSTPVEEIRELFRFDGLVKFCFEQRRKQIGTLLKKMPKAINQKRSSTDQILAELGINPQDRPETVSLEQWIRLANGVGK